MGSVLASVRMPGGRCASGRLRSILKSDVLQRLFQGTIASARAETARDIAVDVGQPAIAAHVRIIPETGRTHAIGFSQPADSGRQSPLIPPRSMLRSGDCPRDKLHAIKKCLFGEIAMKQLRLSTLLLIVVIAASLTERTRAAYREADLRRRYEIQMMLLNVERATHKARVAALTGSAPAARGLDEKLRGQAE